MTIEVFFKDSATNNIAIPLDSSGNKVVEISNLPENTLHQFHVVFSSSEDFDAEMLATPTGGTVLFEVASIGPIPQVMVGSYYESIQNGSFNASDVYVSTRSLPTLVGWGRKFRCTLGSVTGASHALIQYVGGAQ